MDLQFVTLDVFTSKRLEGNPLAVVSVPPTLKNKLSQATKQKIAAEFNLSETVFLHEPEDPQQDQRHIDIFTIECEIPFAGHPTIGSAVLVKYHLHPHVHTLVTKAGSIGLAPQDNNRIRAKIPHNTHLHARTLAAAFGDSKDTSPDRLSPDPAIRAAELQAPVFSVVRGMTFVLVKLPSLESLARVTSASRLDFDALPSPLLDEEWRDSFVCRYYYVDMGTEGDERLVRARMVELGFEDPATGSAASALASYLTLHEERKGTKFRVTQGVEMGRTSDIRVETTTREGDGGAVELVDLWLGGTAVVVMKGTLTVDV
ncbi:Diaminopimelate epimerase-like protein [Hypomontagnella monticulosa]|nr:Diaminopimelate epimerase-like protein [Hypomontagnella monticulosa]